MKCFKLLVYLIVFLLIFSTGAMPSYASDRSLITFSDFAPNTVTVCEGGNYAWVTFNINKIVKIDSAGNIIKTVRFPNPSTDGDIRDTVTAAVDSSNNVYVVLYWRSNKGEVAYYYLAKMDSNGNIIGTPSQIPIGGYINRFAVDSAGNYYILGGDFSSLTKYDSNFGNGYNVATLSSKIKGVVVKGDSVYYTRDGWIWRYKPSDNSKTKLLGGFNNYNDLACDDYGNFYGFSGDKIYKINSSGAVSTYGQGYGSICSVSGNTNGTVYYADGTSGNNGRVNMIAPPVLSGITPTTGTTAGGTQVTLYGSNFTGTTAVSFGGTAASFTVNSNTQITAVSPQHAIGSVNVMVTAGQTCSLGKEYIYKAATTTNVTASPSTQYYNSPVTLTAAVTGSTPTGTVTFYDNGSPIGTSLALNSGQATMTISNLSLGAHSITAYYSGDAQNVGSMSNPVSETIIKVKSTTSLTVSPTPTINYNSPVTLTAAVTGLNPTGAVTFYDNGSPIGTALTLNSGQATKTVSNLTLGIHNITALYSGDIYNESGTSSAVTETVVPGPVNVGRSTITASKLSVTADGTDASTITVTLRDAYDNPISAKTVTLLQGSQIPNITPVNAATNASGKATFTVKSTKAEVITYTPSVDGVPMTLTLQVTFIPGALESFKVTAGDIQTAGVPFSVMVTAQDHNGNTITNYTGTVHFSTNNGNSPGGTAPSLPEDYTFKASDAGTHAFSSGVTLFNAAVSALTATDTVNGTITGTKGSITVNAAPVDTGRSTVTASKEFVTADGTDSSTITVTLKDAYSNPVNKKTVTMAQETGISNISTANAVSNTAGTVTFTVKSTKANIVTYTAKVNGSAVGEDIEIGFIPGPAEALVISAAGTQTAGTPFDMTVTVKDNCGNIVTDYTGTVQLTSTDAAAVLPGNHTFSAGEKGVHEFSGMNLKTAGIQTVTATDTVNGSVKGNTGNITVNAGEVDPGKSTATASKLIVTADGTDSSTITVTLKDAYENVISGKIVTLDEDGGSSVVDAVYCTTRIDGTAVFIITDTLAEQVTYTAKVNGSAVGEDIEIGFIPGPAEALVISAAGTQTAGTPFDMTVTVKDNCGNTVTGYMGTVMLTSTDIAAVLPGSHTFAAADKGVYKFDGITLKTAGVHTITAADTATGTVTGNTGNITVNAGTNYAGQSTVAASKPVVTADGVDSSIITVTLKDDFGNRISGNIVTFDQGSGSSVVEAVYGTTRIDGTAVFVVTDRKAEEVTYRAKVDGKAVNQTAVINFVPGAAETLIVSAAETQKAGIPFSLTVTVRDYCGNTVAGYTGAVKLISTDTAAVLPVSHTFTAADKGVYQFDGLTMKTAGVQIITAVDTANGSLTGSTGNITVEIGSAYDATSTAAADKTVVTADGKDIATITVTLKDDFGNRVSGKTVTLNQGSGSSVIKTVNGTSNIDGTAVFTVASTKAEQAVYMIVVNGKAIPRTVMVSFIPGKATQLVWKTQPGGGAGGQVWPQQPVLVLKDAYDNVVTGDSSSKVTVSLKNSNEAILGGTTEVIFKNGEAAFNNLSVDKRGSYKLTPTIDIGGIIVSDSDYFRISLVPAPIIDPNGGTFVDSTAVAIEYDDIPECEAYYSLDGTKPTQDSVFYAGPFTVFSNCTVTAAVYDSVYGEWSGTTEAEFIIQLPMPTANPTSGSTIDNNSTVTLSDVTQGVTIYHTTDGSIPGANSSVGNSVKISGIEGSTVTVKAYAGKAGNKDSEVAEFKYIIKQTSVNNNDKDPKPTVNMPAPNNPPPTAVVSGGSISVTAPKLDSTTGKASTTVDSGTLASAFNGAQTGGNGVKTVEINISIVQDAKAYETTFPVSYISSGNADTAIRIKTDIAAVTVPGNMLPAANAGGAQNVALTIAAGDKTKLDTAVQAQIGDRPVIELNLKIDGQKVSWSNEDAPVTVSVAYTPTAAELLDPEHITVWYIDGSGNAVSVPSGRYDPATGKVTFTTTHFSTYAVSFVQKSFKDLEKANWAKKQIGVLTSKGIMEGRTNTEFAPSAGITRAEYVSALIRTLGLNSKVYVNFSDMKAGNPYYNEIGIAKKLGITSGVDGNKFNPNATISRQDMMVLTERALRSLKKVSQKGSAADLERFADKNRVAAYAVDSMASLVKEGLIAGGGSNINPLSDTTRAEAAVFLYRIYNIK